MTSIKKHKYFKFVDIQRILTYIFNRTKRPSFIQFRTKPKSVILVFLKEFKLKTQNNISLKEKLDNTELGIIQKEYKGYDNNLVSDNNNLVSENNNTVSEILYNYGFETAGSINENLSLEILYKNLLTDTTVIDKNLDYITEEAINMIEKHDIYLMFSYTKYIKDKEIFNSDIFKSYVKPNKKTKYFLIGIDCEMLITASGKKAGRVSMVDNKGNLIYDKYVFPTEPVLDFLEEFSGLNYNNTKNGIEFSKMQEEILEYIGTNTYLCGHGLENDLEVLELYTERIIDTAYLFLNSQGYKLKLKQLTWCYLKETIQIGNHDPFEDALSCLKLLNYKIQQLNKIYDPKSNKINIIGNIKYIDDLNEIQNNLYLNSLFFYKANIQEIKNIKKSSDLFPIFFYEKGDKIFLSYN